MRSYVKTNHMTTKQHMWAEPFEYTRQAELCGPQNQTTKCVTANI